MRRIMDKVQEESLLMNFTAMARKVQLNNVALDLGSYMIVVTRRMLG